MMQRSRRIAVYAVVTGLLTAGTLTATSSVAHANVAGFCDGSGAAATCSLSKTIAAPTSVTVGVTATDNGEATVTWTASCTLNGTTASVSAGTTSKTPAQVPLTPLPSTAAGQCTVSATVSLPTTVSTNALSVAMTYTTGASPSPSPSPTPSPSPVAYHPFKGYNNKCLDDWGNGSADRTKIVIWTCNPADSAQYWQYSGGELVHNGKCVNDQRGGGDRSHAILYTCNGAANEIWTHLSNGELVLKANGGKYCLDDPAYSTRNGTQLILYTCNGGANQRWYQI